jgi:hypothetical protein
MGVEMFFSVAPLPPSDPDRLPSSPPAEVLDALGAADAAYEELNESGRELRFRLGARGGVVVEFRDFERRELVVLMPSQALELACGAPEP